MIGSPLKGYSVGSIIRSHFREPSIRKGILQLSGDPRAFGSVRLEASRQASSFIGRFGLG